MVYKMPSAESEAGKKARRVFANILSTHSETLFTRGSVTSAWKSAAEDLVLNEDCDFKKLAGKSDSVKRIYQTLCEARIKEIADAGSSTGRGDQQETEYQLTLDELMATERRAQEDAKAKKADKSAPAQVLQEAMVRSVSLANANRLCRSTSRRGRSGMSTASTRALRTLGTRR